MKQNYNRIGIMGGRLSNPIDNKIQAFPKFSWRDEFEKAAKCGFELIEWVFDTDEKNPLCNNEGINEIRSLSQKTGIIVNSVCADYFMEKMLFNVSEFELRKNLVTLQNLIENCHKLEITILEIPLVDSSSLKTDNDKEQLVKNLHQILPVLEQNSLFLTLETDLPSNSFKKLLSSFNHLNVKANYDIGNSIALGYDIKDDLTTLGSLISNIHVKDRKYHGYTVPLGEGDANFELFFNTLSQINYKGDFIIQGAREFSYKLTPEETCIKYLQFVKIYVDKYFSHTSGKLRK